MAFTEGEKVLIHETCTSSDLPGPDNEHLDMGHLNELHLAQTGTNISDNPVVARMQREQAIRRNKRKQTQ